MTNAREEAQDPATTPERLHELINLVGDRGNIDSDAGWCREYVAANPSASLETLIELAGDKNDFMSRLNAAKNPVLDDRTLWLLIDDPNDMVANAARERLNLAPKPRPNTIARGVHIPRIDPKTGRVIKP
ncbi:hypothetical protein GCM10023063_19250 [Arthrobacter methylotrophus]|uniref:Uncharacterized protein n=1 Tax=Arthrobacter methylotrophus TaxID=121291 RepID=A0ABV5URK8_9MICC